MTTIGDRLKEYHGIGPGFDFLRVALASAVVLNHAALLTGRREWLFETPLWFSSYVIVPMFFAVSGFLVTGSALRLSLTNFVINRALRIIPALAVVVLISALVIGPIMSKLPLGEYFSDPVFFSYFNNIYGNVRFHLPGVFEENISRNVNGALWTVPFEIACYLGVAFLMALGLVRYPVLMVLALFGLLCLGLVAQFLDLTAILPGWAVEVLSRLTVTRGGQLLVVFMMGGVMFLYRERIPYSRALLLICIVICLVSALVLDRSALQSVPNRFIVLPALAYITIWIGVTPVPIPRFFAAGDYSYGIYLFHDPILQVLIALLPLSFVIGPLGWIAVVLCGLMIVSVCAAFSWHMVEKPILGLRKKFSMVAQVRGVAD